MKRTFISYSRQNLSSDNGPAVTAEALTDSLNSLDIQHSGDVHS